MQGNVKGKCVGVQKGSPQEYFQVHFQYAWELEISRCFKSLVQGLGDQILSKSSDLLIFEFFKRLI
jgi:hypothetical protein